MNNANSNNKLMIERYLLGRMTDEEAASFEERFLASDELLNELEAAERLQQGLQTVAAVDRADGRKEARDGERDAAGVMSLFHSPRYAMAASFLLLVSLGVSSHLMRQNSLLEATGSAPAAQVVELVSVRSMAGDPVNVLDLGEETNSFTLMLDPGFEPYTRHRATVLRVQENGSPKLVWQVDGLQPGFEEGYEDMLALNLPVSVLDEGIYEIQLEGFRDGSSAGDGYQPIDSIRFKCVAE
jgi:hypothetical protein